MNLDRLRAHVGAQRFDDACAWAWRTAAGDEVRLVPAEEVEAGAAEARAQIERYSTRQWRRLPDTAKALLLERARASGPQEVPLEWPDDLGDVPHEIDDLLWYEGDAPAQERMAVALELYRAMPCYANLMGIKLVYDDLPRDVRDTLWAEVRAHLAQPDDRLAEPVAYSLFVDFYEDPSTVHEAWAQTATTEPLEPRRIERVLDSSGPVPFALKEPLYAQLANEPRWHPHIFRSLVRSALDVYGDLDEERARGWLARLDLPPDTPGLDPLRAALKLP
ncbi:MAG TPA: hypothetical protein VHF89_01270 [Solirubrobacteraceae bacterium]|nr:hypothetical protein [Solirubrobacteraceae bacterium]